VFLVLVAPIYVLGASLAVRAGLFDFSKGASLSADDARAVWGFLGAAIAASVSAIGLLLARAQNLRSLAFQQGVEDAKERQLADTDRRLTLDTAIASLQLIGESGAYAPPAVVAGALTTLVHLGHPVIALRCLAAAWPESEAVDVKTATWTMEAAFNTGGQDAQSEAVHLATKNLSTLVPDDPEADTWVPEFMLNQWDSNVNYATRCSIVRLYMSMPLKRSRADWGPEVSNWLIFVLYRIIEADESLALRRSAAAGMQVLFDVENIQDDTLYWVQHERVPGAHIKDRVQEELAGGVMSETSIDECVDRLMTWADA
jgi:hypothetical protein